MRILAPMPGVCGRLEGESRKKERFSTIGFSPRPPFYDLLSAQHRFPTTDKTINKGSHPPGGLDEPPPRKALPRQERMPSSSLECGARGKGFIWAAAWGKEKNRSQKNQVPFQRSRTLKNNPRSAEGSAASDLNPTPRLPS